MGLKTLTSVAGALASKVEAILALGVVGIVFLLVLPMPTELMDFLIAVNLFIAGLLIVLSLYVKGLTSFSTFPVILLLTTLFRLGIEVATSRMILLNADAGAIVDTFGNFVVGGNLVVGLVVFLIVMVVQFIVITKGAERVAEVSARFSLDAMPAKQLAIESELRANLIDQATAKRLRANLDVETQLLGAMDGSMKFVKGDAIAGLMIVTVNLLGGLAVGVMMHNLTMAQAMHKYAVLSIGEGLVAQIPALLTSLTSAILVTRINENDQSGNRKPFGPELVNQVTRYPRAMWTASAVMSGFALIPGMPTFAFLTLAGAAAAAGWYIGRPAPLVTPATAGDQTTGKPGEAAVVHEFNQMDALQLKLPSSMENAPEVRKLVSLVQAARNKLVIDLGMTLPAVVIRYDDAMPADMVEFSVYEVPVYRAMLRPDWFAVVGPYAEHAAELDGVHVEAGAAAGGGDLVWIPASVRNEHEYLHQATVPWAAYLAQRIDQKILRYGPQFTGVQAAQKYVTWMENWMPELGSELKKAMPLSKLADVIQRLLRERISIRNMRLIMETLADHGQRERDVGVLTEYVRFALRDQICHQLAPQARLSVFVLSPELEEHMSGNIRQTATGGMLSLSPAETAEISTAVREMIAAHQAPDSVPVLVCAQDIRRYMRNLMEPDLPELVVLSVTELTSEIQVTVLGAIEQPGNQRYGEDDMEDE
jgi:type III secretion protein V